MAEKDVGEKIKKGAGDLASKAKDFVSEKSVSEESRLWAALGYLLVILIPILVLLTDKKKDRFLAFHAYQSLLLCAAAFILMIALGIVEFLLDMVLPKAVSWLFSLLGLLMWIAIIVLFIYMAYQAYSRKRFGLLVIGVMADKAAR